MKFQNPSIHHSKVNTHTDRQAESNMPFQLFQSWGHNYTICYIKYFAPHKLIVKILANNLNNVQYDFLAHVNNLWSCFQEIKAKNYELLKYSS